MLVPEMFSDHGMFMFLYALREMAASVSNIIRIAQIRYDLIYTDLLACLNGAHPSIQFTMEIATNDRLPFIGMEIIKIDGSLETCVYRKKTNKGLVLYYQSHVDSGYKRSLLTLSRPRGSPLTSKIVWR